MKNIVLILLLLVAGAAFAQIDRSKAPAPAAAREIKLGEPQTFTLKNGLQVFVVENHKLPRVQFSLELKNDPIKEGAKVGLGQMAGTLLGTGTSTKTKAQIDEEVDFIGADLSTYTSGVFASSLTKHTDKLLTIMTDVLYNPAFASAELDKLKTQTLSGLQASKDNPNSISTNVRRVLVYGKNHPYGEVTTEKSIESITLEDCKSYFNTYFKPNNAYLIIVGDIDVKTAKTLSEKYFAKWTKGDVKAETYTKPIAPAKTYVALVDRPASVQSVINISYPLDFHPANPDAIKARVLNEILGAGFSSRLMQNLREKHGYTYGARSTLSSDKLAGNFNASASVRNEVTDSSVYEFMSELKRITVEPVTDLELKQAKAAIAGSFGRSLESPQTVANFALNVIKYGLPKDYYNNYLKSLDAVTKEDVLAVAKKFIRPENATIVIVGKGVDIADKLKPFGEVKYFDINGEPFTPAKAGDLPAGITPEKIIADYIQAIGGEQKLKAITAIKTVMKAAVQGMEVTISNTKKIVNKSISEVSASGMTFTKVVSDGKDVSMTQSGQKIPLDDKAKNAIISEGAIVPELVYKSNGTKLSVTGIEKVEGADAYAVEIISAGGVKSVSYFDKTTGLKLKTIITIEGPQGTTSQASSFQNYKEVSGIKFPHTVLQNMGPMTIKAEVTSLEVNPTIDDSLFAVEK